MITHGLCALILTSSAMPPDGLAAFRSDLDFVISTIEKTHPAPFSRADEPTFRKDADALKAQGGESEGCAVAELMALVAELHDGHSYINPINVPHFDRWYPIRFYWLKDGLYVTAVAPEYRSLVGRRVIQLGSLSSAEAMAKIVDIRAANNPLAAPEGVVWLSNAALAEALGAAPGGEMKVTVVDEKGGLASQTLRAVTGQVSDSWTQQGEIFGPRFSNDSQPYVTAFSGRGPLDFRKNDPALPPQLRNRVAYYMLEMPDSKLLYFQWNSVHDSNNESFAEFTKRLFATLDLHPEWRLIIDVRYNGGGDGSMVPPFIRQIIKRDRFDSPGNLFVFIGRKTFSAAVDFIGEAKNWTSAIFVGEPAGAGVNHFGDAAHFETPNLHIKFNVSTQYHQHALSLDQSGEFDPDIPATMTAADYFAGRDPALEAVTQGGDCRPVPVIAAAQGAGTAKAELRRREAEWRSIPWWKPFRERDMDDAGYQLLQTGRITEAVAVFQLNAEEYPGSWNVWDSLAEAERAAGDLSAAREHYTKSLSLNAGNENARKALSDMNKKGP